MSEITGVVQRFIEKYNISGTVLCALSGGCDSVVMLHVLSRLLPADNIVALHLNHNWRAEESDRDEEFSRQFAHSLSIRFFSERLGADVRETETDARAARYDFFERCAAKFGSSVLMLAHNKNDNAETLLYRVIKGTGPAGLCAMVQKRGIFYRPLLEVSRREIEEYANKHGLNYVCDSSNEDTRYARNLIRKEILPLMQKINPDVIDAASNLIKLSNMHSRIISNSLECVKNELLTDKNEIFLDKFFDLDESLKFEIMNDFLACELKNRDYSRIKSYVDFVLRGGRKKSLNGKVFLEVCGNKIFKTRVCEKKLTEIKITGPGVYDFEGIKVLIEKVSSKCDFKNKNGVKYLNLDFKDDIILRTRRDGDVFSPCGMKNGKMKLKKYLINEKIPRQMRDNLLLLANKDEILCILGIQISQKAVVAENTSCYRVKISE